MNPSIPSFRLDDDVALVTGAGSGIGRGVAALLARAGATVIAGDRDAGLARATAAVIGEQGGRCVEAVFDVADEQAVGCAISQIADTHGRLDILVNNAGIYPVRPLTEVDEATWNRTFDVNLRGAFWCMRAAAARMRNGGRIVNVSSIDSLRPSGPGLGHYGASKAALNALTRSAALEFGPLGIRVNAVLPGVIATEGTSQRPPEFVELGSSRTPLRRIGDPGDIAGAVLFLVSGAATFVQGHALVVDGGLTIAA